MKRCIFIILCSLLIAGSNAAPVFAEEPTLTIPDSLNNIYMYKEGSACVTGGATTLTGNDNIEKALRFFVGKGLTLMQAAAIAGNLQQESTFNPTITNSIGAYGIAQWLGGRKANLQKKPNYNTLEVQLEFIWEELNGAENAGLRALQGYSGSNVSELAVIFGETYERYGSGEEGKRGQFAAQIYETYKSSIPDGSNAQTASAGGSSLVCSGAGTSDFSSDSFVVYDQCDPNWARIPYSDGTICSSGCGPAAMAMIVTAMTGQQVTPVETAKFYTENGGTSSAGSNWTITPVAAANWGLKSETFEPSVAKVNEVLRSGGLVYTSGRGPRPFISGGHFIVIRGVTSSGKWLIGNSYVPNSLKATETKSTEWDPNDIVPYMRGSTTAITKG